MENSKFQNLLQSRKFWASVVGLVAIFYTAYVSGSTLDSDVVVTAIMGIVAAYIGATSYEDAQHAKAEATVQAAAMQQPTSPTVGIDTNNVTVTPTVTDTGLK